MVGGSGYASVAATNEAKITSPNSFVHRVTEFIHVGRTWIADDEAALLGTIAVEPITEAGLLARKVGVRHTLFTG
jgi:hypothetical protein